VIQSQTAEKPSSIRRYVLVAVIVLTSLPFVFFTYTYVRYGLLIDAQLRKGVFSHI
jgi:hypothetical protein